MKFFRIAVFSVCFLYGCNFQENKNSRISRNAATTAVKQTEDGQPIINKPLSDFINNLYFEGQTDTFYFEETFEEPIQGHEILISKHLSSKFNIDFSFETSLVVNNLDDKSCVLYNGKHNYSTWQRLGLSEENTYLIPIINENNISISNYSFQDIVDGIKNNCNDNSFIETIKDTIKITDFTNTAISKYYIRLSSPKISRIICIQAQYGC